ncbi:hypothetical protein OAN33_02555 [Flavobacteriales bacterium]|nr:hypothetical protein [Flavobacteriales bacterium]
MKLSRLLIATVFGASIMFATSYYWHGILLNDLDLISYDKNLFFGLLSILYLLVGGALSFVLMAYKPAENRVLKHLTISVASGFIIYLIAFVLGVSFQGEGIEHTIVNFTWQMLEQGVGGFSISIYYILAHRREKLMAFADVRDDD